MRAETVEPGMTEPGFFIESSNSLPRLLGRLAGVLRDDPLPPLDFERIVVQSAGMRRWVTLELAKELGIAASISMPFPRNAASWLAEKLISGEEEGAGFTGGLDGSDPFNCQSLTWRLMAILGGNLGGDEFAPVRAYLADDDMRKRYQLAAKIASTFDEYQLYRTELLRDWDLEDPDAATYRHLGWQSKLWRRACAGLKGQEHLGDRFRNLITHINRLDGPADRIEGMPRRLSVFGVSSLPPIFIDLLAALGKHIPVTVYRFSPTCSTNTSANGDEGGENRLFSSMGKQGRQFLGLLLEHGAKEREVDGLRVDHAGKGPRTCLQVIQDDILDDVNRGGYGLAAPAPKGAGTGGERTTGAADSAQLPEPGGDEAAPAVPLDPNDRSLTIHNCHSPLREMEVLRDQLLQAFDSMEDLEPSDVLVMVPVIEDYAPYIDAVFGVRHDATPFVPYRIADRGKGEEQPLSEGVLKVLALADARLTATEVIDLLEIPSVRRKAGILGNELPQIRHWVRETNIRWGVDGAFKQDVFGLPPFEANTWRAGLDRLLMGMITGPHDDLVAGVLPLGTATMNHLDLLGRFDTWVTGLFARLDEMRTPRSLTAWADTIADLLENFFAPVGDEERALQTVRDELNRLREAGTDGKGDSNVTAGGPDIPEVAAGAMLLDIIVIRDHLGQALGEEGRPVSFISGAVTFCAMKPLRTIPFRVIAMAGLDDTSFPSKERPPTFDLMAARPRPGDRSVRDDQKQLFLETLSAATDRLIISYVGRSQKDNKERAASVVVDELLNVVDQSFEVPSTDAKDESSSKAAVGDERSTDSPEDSQEDRKRRLPREAITTRHPLQPFSPSYFDGSDDRLFSYSRQNRRAAEGVRATYTAQDPPAAIPFFTEPVPLGEEYAERLTLTLDELIACWTHPCKFFCNRALGIVLPREEAELEDVEPLEMAGLEKYAFENWLANERLKLAAGRGPGKPMPAPDLEREWRVLQARGDLPPDHLGRAYHAQLGTRVQQFVEKVGAPEIIDPTTVELEGKVGGHPWKLTGRIDNLTDLGRIQFRCAALKPKDIIRAWFTHLAYNALLDELEEKGESIDSERRFTRLIATHKKKGTETIGFGRIDDPKRILAAHFESCRTMLRQPVPLFEKTSFAYYNSLRAIEEYEKTQKGRQPQPLWKAAYGEWNGDQYHGGAAEGEKEDAYIKLCFRELNAIEELKEEIEHWAWKLWRGALNSRVEL